MISLFTLKILCALWGLGSFALGMVIGRAARRETRDNQTTTHQNKS